MITKKKEDYLFHAGAGRPFDVHPQTQEPKTEKERLVPHVVNLAELNVPGKSPVNYSPKRGRIYPKRGYTQDTDEQDFDIE